MYRGHSIFLNLPCRSIPVEYFKQKKFLHYSASFRDNCVFILTFFCVHFLYFCKNWMHLDCFESGSAARKYWTWWKIFLRNLMRIQMTLFKLWNDVIMLFSWKKNILCCYTTTFSFDVHCIVSEIIKFTNDMWASDQYNHISNWYHALVLYWRGT